MAMYGKQLFIPGPAIENVVARFVRDESSNPSSVIMLQWLQKSSKRKNQINSLYGSLMAAVAVRLAFIDISFIANTAALEQISSKTI